MPLISARYMPLYLPYYMRVPPVIRVLYMLERNLRLLHGPCMSGAPHSSLLQWPKATVHACSVHIPGTLESGVLVCTAHGKGERSTCGISLCTNRAPACVTCSTGSAYEGKTLTNKRGSLPGEWSLNPLDASSPLGSVPSPKHPCCPGEKRALSLR